MSNTDSAVDAFIKKTTRWPAETAALREILLGCGLNESIKWGKPCFAHGGKNVVIIQGFAEHCALMFFRGTLLSDPKKILKRQGPNAQAAMRIEYRSVAEVKALAPTLRAYVAEAVGLVDAGTEVAFADKEALVLPDELKAAFKKKPALGKAFSALTPGRQRAYVLHINGAKQSTTKVARIEKCTPQILAGKGMNDRD
jgi:uncharacterized protein YdeI (YjbR/CyaY-like superfamily)